ncbi:MAG: hypothetical protein IV101_02070, partial [Dechloromonas sp.]|nr:hypothetical protein [Dechloromonas sp.]
MKRYLLSLVVAAFPLVAWSGPVCVDPEHPGKSHQARDGIGGIGGTGSPATGKSIGHNSEPGGGGIGGTGSPALGGEEGGGIGGTGAPVADGASVGIVGVVSGFASVCVNGVEVHFDHGVPVNENGDPSSADKLAVGQVVSIDATNSPKGLQARNIAILNALEGPITKLSHGGKVIQVLGQNVAVGPNTRGPGKGLAIGQLVKVSALAGADGTLVATRVQPSPNLKQAGALGQVVTSGKQSRVGGVAVSAAVDVSAALVRGQWTGSELVPTSVTADPTYRFKNSASRILLEALVQTSDGRGKITAGGVELSLPNATASQMKSLQPNRRIFVDAQVGRSGQLVVSHFELASSENRSAPLPKNAERTNSVSSAKTDSSDTTRSTEKTETSERVEK